MLWRIEAAVMAARAGGQDWFSLLATGATFDMKRFRKQVDVFKGNQGGSGRLRGGGFL